LRCGDAGRIRVSGSACDREKHAAAGAEEVFGWFPLPEHAAGTVSAGK